MLFDLMPAGDELRGRGAAQKAGAANHKYVQDSLLFSIDVWLY